MSDSNPIAPGPCLEFEDAILEYSDQTLSEAECQEVMTHLAGCARCRVFWNDQKRLDAALAAAFSPSTLPQDFKRQMLERVKVEGWATQNAIDGTSDITAALAQLRKEFRKQTFWSALDGVGYATLASLAVAGGYELLSRSNLLAGLSREQIGLYLGIVLGAAAIVSGLWIGCRAQIRLLLDRIRLTGHV